MTKRYTTIGKYSIIWDETYYIAYAGGKRELASKDQIEYNKTLLLPFQLMRQEQKKLGFDKNPNVIPIQGLKLLELIKEKSFVPFFDTFFEQSHLVQINDAIVYESMKQKSYEIAMGI